MTPEQLAAKGLRVRPLAWMNGDRNGGFYAAIYINGLLSGYYQITQEEYGLATVEFGIHCHEFGPDVVWKGPTADAQAAAEAHHATRIAAMIEGAP
jgi:hypothetical protein